MRPSFASRSRVIRVAFEPGSTQPCALLCVGPALLRRPPAPEGALFAGAGGYHRGAKPESVQPPCCGGTRFCTQQRGPRDPAGSRRPAAILPQATGRGCRAARAGGWRKRGARARPFPTRPGAVGPAGACAAAGAGRAAPPCEVHWGDGCRRPPPLEQFPPTSRATSLRPDSESRCSRQDSRDLSADPSRGHSANPSRNLPPDQESSHDVPPRHGLRSAGAPGPEERQQRSDSPARPAASRVIRADAMSALASGCGEGRAGVGSGSRGSHGGGGHGGGPGGGRVRGAGRGDGVGALVGVNRVAVSGRPRDSQFCGPYGAQRVVRPSWART